MSLSCMRFLQYKYVPNMQVLLIFVRRITNISNWWLCFRTSLWTNAKMFTVFLLIPTLLTGRDLEKDKKFCHDCGNKGSQFIPSMNWGMPNEIQRECCKTKGRCSPWQKSCPGTAPALTAKKKEQRSCELVSFKETSASPVATNSSRLGENSQAISTQLVLGTWHPETDCMRCKVWWPWLILTSSRMWFHICDYYCLPSDPCSTWTLGPRGLGAFIIFS